MELFSSKIIEILKLLPKISSLKLSNERASIVTSAEMMQISTDNLSIAGISFGDKLFQSPSSLRDGFVAKEQIQCLVNRLVSQNMFQRINHLGIGYKVDSIENEKRILIDQIKNTNLHLYEENAIEGSAWLFVGDRSKWQDPLVELVLVEHTNDKWAEYWLPHFQIDIDTYLNGDEIESLIMEVFKGKVKPFRMIENEEFIMLVRSRLGTVSGVNIFLDMGFEGRMTRYHRMRLLTQLV